MKKSLFIKYFILGFFIFFVKESFAQNDTSADKALLDKLRAIFDTENKDYGQEIPIDENFYSCIYKYQAIMDKYGFEEKPDRERVSRVLPSRKATYEVIFRGVGLTKWINGIKPPGGDPENIDIHIIKGIYTQKFAGEHGLPSKKVNRITVFLVPYDKNTGKVIGDKAYNLGGIQP